MFLNIIYPSLGVYKCKLWPTTFQLWPFIPNYDLFFPTITYHIHLYIFNPNPNHPFPTMTYPFQILPFISNFNLPFPIRPTISKYDLSFPSITVFNSRMLFSTLTYFTKEKLPWRFTLKCNRLVSFFRIPLLSLYKNRKWIFYQNQIFHSHFKNSKISNKYTFMMKIATYY